MRRISLTLLLALVFPALAAGAARDTNLALVAYSTPREAYAQLIPAFQKTAAGKGVTFSQSYAASGEQSRAVAAGLDTEMKRFYGRSHQWVLYRENGRIVYEARVEPPTPGQKIRIELDQRHHGHWASAGHHGFVENHQGIVRLRFKRGGLPEGGRFRFRSSVGASPNLEGASSDWSLFRITR